MLSTGGVPLRHALRPTNGWGAQLLGVPVTRAGRTVVRLKGGDPSVFARGVDEMGSLSDAGIPWEIVPGITAGLAAAAYCEIPITHYDDASAVALVVGQERRSKQTARLDYGLLAKVPGTLIRRAKSCAGGMDLTLEEFVRRCVEGRVNQIEASRDRPRRRSR